jgi:hypothetical protein
MSESIQKGSPVPPRPEPDYRPWDYENAPPFPKTATAAATLWIETGCVFLAGMAICLYLVISHASGDTDPMQRQQDPGTLTAAILQAIFSVLFIQQGVRTVCGRVRTTLLGGIGTGAVGLLMLALAASSLSRGDLYPATILCLVAAIILASAALALIGRDPYRRWRAAEKARKEAGPQRDVRL